MSADANEMRRRAEAARAAVPPPPVPKETWYEATTREIHASIQAAAESGGNTLDYRLFSTTGQYRAHQASLYQQMPLLLRIIDEFFPQVSLSYYRNPNTLRGDARRIYDGLIATGFGVQLYAGLFRISW